MSFQPWHEPPTTADTLQDWDGDTFSPDRPLLRKSLPDCDIALAMTASVYEHSTAASPPHDVHSRSTDLSFTPPRQRPRLGSALGLSPQRVVPVQPAPQPAVSQRSLSGLLNALPDIAPEPSPLDLSSPPQGISRVLSNDAQTGSTTASPPPGSDSNMSSSFDLPRSPKAVITSDDEETAPVPITPSDLDLTVGRPPQRLRATRHSEFYLDGGMVTFLVEETLFRAHRFFLERESEMLRQMIRMPLPGRDGITEERAIPLVDVKVTEFECLMDFFYNGMFNDGPPRSFAQLTALLRISSALSFPRVRQRAITEIEAMPDVDAMDKIILAQDLDISHWMEPARKQLARREQPLQVDEAERLGARLTALVAQEREKVLLERIALLLAHSQGNAPADKEVPKRRIRRD